MLRMCGSLLAIACSVAVTGCVTTVSAPGASRVRLTKDPGEVAGCTAVGNIQPFPQSSASAAMIQFRNRVVGFGGNTGLITRYVLDDPIEGIAYRCPAEKKSAGG